jgi:PRTRC genetic system protein A
MELELLQHLVVNPDGSLPEIPGCLHAYILAGNGVFVYATRTGLEVLIPVAMCKIAGLPELTPQVNITKRVPALLLDDALRFSKYVFPNEALFWFNWTDEWSVHIPGQRFTNASVVPCDRHDQAGTSALIDLHSHGRFSSFFSLTDDQDEVGFRIYAVIGSVDKAPTISARVGVYSHYFNIPASTVFEMPDGMKDIYEQEDFQHEVE